MEESETILWMCSVYYNVVFLHPDSLSSCRIWTYVRNDQNKDKIFMLSSLRESNNWGQLKIAGITFGPKTFRRKSHKIVTLFYFKRKYFTYFPNHTAVMDFPVLLSDSGGFLASLCKVSFMSSF